MSHLLDPEDSPGVSAQEGPSGGLPGTSMTAEAALAAALRDAMDASEQNPEVWLDYGDMADFLAKTSLAALDDWTLVPRVRFNSSHEPSGFTVAGEVAQRGPLTLDDLDHGFEAASDDDDGLATVSLDRADFNRLRTAARISLAPRVATADWTGSTKRAVPDAERLRAALTRHHRTLHVTQELCTDCKRAALAPQGTTVATADWTGSTRHVDVPDYEHAADCGVFGKTTEFQEPVHCTCGASLRWKAFIEACAALAPSEP